MKQVLIALALLCATTCVGATSETVPPFSTNCVIMSFSHPRYFSSVRRTNDDIIIRMPLTAEPFNAYLNGEDLGPMTQDLEVGLKPHDQLQLQWKRATIWAVQDVDMTPSELHVIRVFDGSDFGAPITTNYFILREQEE